ncbi:hypothetical protein [Janthinobacterium aquaticum]|uniref:hypothetical protein n=1 Tax=Janthinobacterium sp. FT58W TaxID=2654254 RepID=UPI00126578FD|nr:hypothetical protein [Janthinobacterium sp. FT58W]KAB8041803.1 hypothetical protein GCM43_16475 [Janthinobacterium sp. FT58W]
MGGLTHKLLQRRSEDAQEVHDTLQRIALYVLQREQIFDDSVLRDARIAALAPQVAALVMIAEWLAYVEWEGYASARHMKFDSVLAQLSAALQLPLLAEQLQQAVNVQQFEALRPVLLQALLAHVERHVAMFP